jgi:hypothetical protein
MEAGDILKVHRQILLIKLSGQGVISYLLIDRSQENG